MHLRIACLLLFASTHCLAQGTIQVGVKLGVGGSLIPLHSTLAYLGKVDKVYAGSILSTGVYVQYLIAERFGIESGLVTTHHSFYLEEDAGLWRKRLWKGAAAVELLDYHIPLMFIYRSPLGFDRTRDITLTAGKSIDCLSSAFTLRVTSAEWLTSFCASVRIGKEHHSGRRFEYGLDFQYSTHRFQIADIRYENADAQIDSRICSLTFNIYYSFSNNRLGDRTANEE